MVYRRTIQSRVRFRNVPLGAAFVFASASTATPLVKDGRHSYRDGSGQSVDVDDVSAVTLLRPLLGEGPAGGTAPITCGSASGAGDPTGVTTPEFSGQLYHDTVNDVYYRSTGTTSADWMLISMDLVQNGHGAPSTAPSTGVGIYIDVDTDSVYYYNGSSWVLLVS